MRRFRSVYSVRAALATAVGLSALSCGSTGTGVASPEASNDAGPMADTGTPVSPDATSSPDSTSGFDASARNDGTSPLDAISPYDATAIDAANPADGAADGIADSEVPDVSKTGCSPMLVGGQITGYVTCKGQLQRLAVVDCPNLLSQGATRCSFDSGSCSTNQDCKAGPYGACNDVYQNGQAPTCGCGYGCVRDSDCASDGEICVCGDPFGYCVLASCNAGTCATGFACAAYTSGCDTAFACQSASDQCENNGDCDDSGARTCYMGVDGGGSQCGPPPPCGMGRPFFVAGKARLPAIASADAWCVATVKPDLSGLSPHLRAEVARHWTATARMEHASIAAFARFALQLLALGAPPDLLLDAQRAMADETAHAQLAFTFASALTGRDVGPGPLAVNAALDETSLRDLVATTFAEGCIGETVAAVEATEAAALARDPAVRAALEKIAADETRHAELAWRTVKWALRQAGANVGGFVRRCVAQVEAEARDLASAPPGSDDETFVAYGVLGQAHKLQLRHDVLREIVLPSARALLGSLPGPLESAAQPLMTQAT